MRIIAYSTSSGHAPEGHEAFARFLLPTGSFHPVVIPAATASEATERAQAWWDQQIANERAKREGIAARAEARRKSKEPA